MSYEFGLQLKQCEIVSLLTPPGTPQCNGVSECHNRTLLDMVRSMMSLTNLPLSFWGYALETVAFTLNRAPSKSVEMTPYELWFSNKPKLSFLKIWGCDAYVKKFHPDKLKPKSEKCVFIEYPKEINGYTFYDRSEGKIFVAKNGSFLEKEFLSKEVSGRKVELDEVTVPAPLLEIVHTDVCGPMSVEARGRYHYFLTFTDNLSRYGYIYLMKHKSETFEKFKEF